MTLTRKLKDWAIENLGVEKAATDDEFTEAIKDATPDKLNPEKLIELTKTEDPMEKLANTLAGAFQPMVKQLADTAARIEKAAMPAETKESPEAASTESGDFEKRVDARVQTIMAQGETRDFSQDTHAKMVADSAGDPRVKKSIERYSLTKTALTYPMTRKGSAQPHPFAGKPVLWGNKILERPSEAELAVIGATFKWKLQGTASSPCMTEHDKELVMYAMDELPWNGSTDHDWKSKPFRGERFPVQGNKETILLDSALSGGSLIVPQVLEEALIIEPLLSGELWPEINIVSLARGSSVRRGVWGAGPTVAAIEEGTAVELFTTDGLITNLDTTIFKVGGAIKFGRDWADDAPANIGATIMARFGEFLAQWGDEVIAVGNGATQPLGWLFKSGALTSTTGTATTAAYIPANIENLIRTMPLQIRRSRGGRTIFVSEDGQYWRVVQVPVGGSDARRIFFPDMNPEKYEIMGHPAKIQEGVPQGTLMYVHPMWYTMYQREGMRFTQTVDGQTLVLENAALIAMDARFGGQPDIANSVVIQSDGPATG